MKKKLIENLIVTLIAVFISLPTYADDNANTSNVYKLVTKESELTTDGTLFIIANKDSKKALCKNFYNLNRNVDNLEEMQPYGDFFIINDKIATFKLNKIKSGYKFQLEPYETPNIGFLSCDNLNGFWLQSTTYATMTITVINKEGNVKVKRTVSPYSFLEIKNNNLIQFEDDYS